MKIKDLFGFGAFNINSPEGMIRNHQSKVSLIGKFRFKPNKALFDKVLKDYTFNYLSDTTDEESVKKENLAKHITPQKISDYISENFFAFNSVYPENGYIVIVSDDSDVAEFSKFVKDVAKMCFDMGLVFEMSIENFINVPVGRIAVNIQPEIPQDITKLQGLRRVVNDINSDKPFNVSKHVKTINNVTFNIENKRDLDSAFRATKFLLYLFLVSQLTEK